MVWLLFSQSSTARIVEELTICPFEGGVYFPRDKYWQVRYRYQDGTARSIAYYIAEKDTLIGGKAYTPVTVSEMERMDGISGLVLKWPSLSHNVLFRQEGDRVYYLPQDTKEECLVLDYGLMVGETFASPSGERFTVTEKGFFEEFRENVCNYQDSTLLMLRLRSEETGREDVWIEGMGSIYWGIMPPYVLQGLPDIREMPVDTQVYIVTRRTHQGLDYMFDVNEDAYKFVHFTPDGIERSDKDLHTDFSFSGDTLCIDGIVRLPDISLPAYVECFVEEDKRITTYFNGLHMIIMGEPPVAVNLKIPGFTQGTYSLYGQTLVCPSTDGIGMIKDGGYGNLRNNAAYDLSGRRTDKPTKGIYIQNGRKVVK